MRDAYVTGSPKIMIIAAPVRNDCKKARDAETGNILYNDWGGAKNVICECPNCTLASAQAIRWTVQASGLWDETSNRHIRPHRDTNKVNGVFGAPDGGTFRGLDKSVVEVKIIPASYDDSIVGYSNTAFRLQFGAASHGAVATFDTTIDVFDGSYNTTGALASAAAAASSTPATSSSLQYVASYSEGNAGSLIRPGDLLQPLAGVNPSAAYKEYINDDLRKNFILPTKIGDTNFLDEDLANMVYFEVSLQQADVMLTSSISILTKMGDFAGTCGGLLSVLTGLIVLLMTRVQHVVDPKSPMRRFSREESERMIKILASGLMPGVNVEKKKSLTAKEELELREIFDSIDADGSGEIDAGEFHQAFRKMAKATGGRRSSRRQSNAMFAATDVDRSGEISYDEFRAIFVEGSDEIDLNKAADAAAKIEEGKNRQLAAPPRRAPGSIMMVSDTSDAENIAQNVVEIVPNTLIDGSVQSELHF